MDFKANCTNDEDFNNFAGEFKNRQSFRLFVSDIRILKHSFLLHSFATLCARCFYAMPKS